MPTNRCSICGLNWPLEEAYATCPQCELRTSPVGNIRSMPADEAKSLKRHLEFERFYDEWDESHPSDRLATSDLPAYEPVLPAAASRVAS